MTALTHIEIDPEQQALLNMQRDLADLIAARLRDPKELGRNAEWARWTFYKSLSDWLGGHDIEELLENVCHELSIDKDGDPVDENGLPLRTVNYGRVHPDNPCQEGVRI